ncbi:aldo/keto reductase [Bacillus tianshenii]|nr:aldo/keto reductase [Bacillus tianshenii]
MEKVKLSDNLKLSRLVHGHWRMADWNMTKEERVQLVEQTAELGITSIDHADIYGSYTCEQLFGEALALKPGLRKDLQIITKCGIKLKSKNRPEHQIKYYDTSKEHIFQSVENSLKNFQTDYIDTLLIHRPDPYMDPEEVAEAFTTLKKQGKVLHFGVSNFTPSQFNMLSEYLSFPLVTNQIEISPLYLGSFDNGAIEQCQQKGISPMAWSPLAGGKLFKAANEQAVRVRSTLEKIMEEVGADSIDQVAYAWLLNHPANILPVIGTGNIERIRSAVKALEIKLTRQQWFEVWQSSTGKEVD